MNSHHAKEITGLIGLNSAHNAHIPGATPQLFCLAAVITKSRLKKILDKQIL